MKTKYKYIHFELYSETKKYQRWVIVNNKTKEWLGFIEWYPSWKEYVFYPEPNTFFNDSCLSDVIDFIKQLKEKK